MSTRRQLQKRGSSKSSFIPSANPLKTRGFGKGIQARSAQLPKANPLQTRPFGSPIPASAQQEETESASEQLEIESRFGYNGLDVPVNPPEPPPVQRKGEGLGNLYQPLSTPRVDSVLNGLNQLKVQQLSEIQKKVLSEEEPKLQSFPKESFAPKVIQRQGKGNNQDNQDYTEADKKDALELNGLAMFDMLPKLANMKGRLEAIKKAAQENMVGWKPRVQYGIDVVQNIGNVSPESYIISKQGVFGNIEWDAWEAIYRFLGGQPKSPGDPLDVNGQKGVIYKHEIRIGGPKTWLTNNPGALTTGALEQLEKEGTNVKAYKDDGGKFKVHGKGTKGDPPFGSFPVVNTSKSAQAQFDDCEGSGFDALKAWIGKANTIRDIAKKQLGGQVPQGDIKTDQCGSSSKETISRYTNCLIATFSQLGQSVKADSPVPSVDDYCTAAKAVAMIEGWTSFTDKWSKKPAKKPGFIVRLGSVYLERTVKPVGGSLKKFKIEENPLQKPPTIIKGFEDKFECWLLLAGLNKNAK